MEHAAAQKSPFTVTIEYVEQTRRPRSFEHQYAAPAWEDFWAAVEARGGPRPVAHISFYKGANLIERWLP